MELGILSVNDTTNTNEHKDCVSVIDVAMKDAIKKVVGIIVQTYS